MQCVFIILAAYTGLGITFGPEVMSVGVQVSHPPPHHPSPVKTWWFKRSFRNQNTYKQITGRARDL